MKKFSNVFRFVWLTGTLVLALGAGSRTALAVQYPYALPDAMSARLDIDLAHKTNFNNLLLGLNCGWPEMLYGMVGYNNPDAQKLITAFHPTSLRFPHGVWANFYDWEVDGRRIYDGYSRVYLRAVKDHPDLRYGFPGFTMLHSNLNFDVLFTWNVDYDSPSKGVARLRDQDAKGFDTQRIELGNENFYKSQCSRAISNVQAYIRIAGTHAAALRATKPTLQISVPVEWKHPDGSWNMALAATNFYDAVSVHVYNRFSDGVTTNVLRAGNFMLDAVRPVRALFPGKPIWLSEWAVYGGDGKPNALSVLGMADVYLCFFNHPELFGGADYFQMNAGQPMFQYDKNTHAITKTSYGAAYEMIRDIFENSQIVEDRIQSSTLVPGVNAIEAQTVIKHGQVIVFAINKTTNSIPLSLNFNGVRYTNGFTHRTLVFDGVNAFKTFGLTENPLTTVASDQGAIRLLPLSLNEISGLNLSGGKNLPAN